MLRNRKRYTERRGVINEFKRKERARAADGNEWRDSGRPAHGNVLCFDFHGEQGSARSKRWSSVVARQRSPRSVLSVAGAPWHVFREMDAGTFGSTQLIGSGSAGGARTCLPGGALVVIPRRRRRREAAGSFECAHLAERLVRAFISSISARTRGRQPL